MTAEPEPPVLRDLVEQIDKVLALSDELQLYQIGIHLAAARCQAAMIRDKVANPLPHDRVR